MTDIILVDFMHTIVISLGFLFQVEYLRDMYLSLLWKHKDELKRYVRVDCGG